MVEWFQGLYQEMKFSQTLTTELKGEIMAMTAELKGAVMEKLTSLETSVQVHFSYVTFMQVFL